jgi:nucleotide-binding universal stress UspA family protein
MAKDVHVAFGRRLTVRFTRILVPTDFSPAADAALDTALELARMFKATIVLMHAYGIPSYAYAGLEHRATTDYGTALEQVARDALNQLVAARADGGVPIAAALYSGTPWEQILLAIEQHDIGLVVMGTHGRSVIAQAFLGSVAEKVVRLCPVPVLTVHPRAEPARRNS